MFSLLFLTKILSYVGIGGLLLYGGCSVRDLINARSDLRECQTEAKASSTQLIQAKKALQEAKAGTDKSVTEALAKSAIGAEVDCDKKNYKLTAKNCRTILRREAEEIANKTKRMLQ